MKIINSLIGGLAGAIALNVLHQTVAKLAHNAPRVDLVGEEGLTKTMEAAGVEPLKGDALFTATLAADVLSNAAYYSVIGLGKRKYLPMYGAAHGLIAGVGALVLTRPLGLRDAPVTRTTTTKVLTVCWYTFGGIVAGAVMQALNKR